MNKLQIPLVHPGNILWNRGNPGGEAILFDWQTSRGHDCLLHMLQRPNQTDPAQPILYYRGILQCDGYSAYETLARKIPGIQLAGCMAHVRRKEGQRS